MNIEKYDDTHIPYGYMSLKTFRMKPLNQETIDCYKEIYPALRHVRWNFNTKGILFLDSFYKVACYVNIEIKTDGSVWIEALEVNAKYRNRGLGKQLLLLAIKDLNANYLSVDCRNKVAYNLYKEYGFEVYYTNGTILFMKRNEIMSKSMESLFIKKKKDNPNYDTYYDNFKTKYESRFIEIRSELVLNLSHSLYRESSKYPYLQYVKVSDEFSPYIYPDYHNRYYILEDIISFFTDEYLSRRRDPILLTNRTEDICRKYEANKMIYESKFRILIPNTKLTIEKTDKDHLYLLQIYHIDEI